MTFKEYKKLWDLPADIKARESRIEKLLHRKEAIAQEDVYKRQGWKAVNSTSRNTGTPPVS